MSPVCAVFPTRVRVDTHSVAMHTGQIESAVDVALGRAVANALARLPSACSGDATVVHPPKFTWLGEGVDGVTLEVRDQFEQRMAALFRARVNAGVVAAAPTGTVAEAWASSADWPPDGSDGGRRSTLAAQLSSEDLPAPRAPHPLAHASDGLPPTYAYAAAGGLWTPAGPPAELPSTTAWGSGEPLPLPGGTGGQPAQTLTSPVAGGGGGHELVRRVNVAHSRRPLTRRTPAGGPRSPGIIARSREKAFLEDVGRILEDVGAREVPTEAEIRESELAVAKEIRASELALIEEFQRRARDVALAALADNEKLVRAEQGRYGEVSSGDPTTQANRLRQAAGDLALVQREISARVVQLPSWPRYRGVPMPANPAKADEYLAPDRYGLDPEVQTAGRRLEELRRIYGPSFPVLLQRNIDYQAIAKADPQTLEESVTQTTSTVLTEIRRARDRLNEQDGPELVWSLPPVIEATRRAMGILPGTPADAAISAYAAKRKLDEDFLKLGLAALGIGLAIGAIVLSAGTATPAVATGAALLELGVATTTVIAASQTWKEYEFQRAAAGSALDPSEALLREEPSLIWLWVEIIGAVGDVGAAVLAFRTLARTAKLVRTGEDLAQLRETALAQGRVLEWEGKLGRATAAGGREAVTPEQFADEIVSKASQPPAPEPVRPPAAEGAPAAPSGEPAPATVIGTDPTRARWKADIFQRQAEIESLRETNSLAAEQKLAELQRDLNALRERNRAQKVSTGDPELDAAIDAAFEEHPETGKVRAESPRVKGKVRPTIDDRPVPTRKLPRLDMEHIERGPGESMGDAVDRVGRLIGQTIESIPVLREAWQRARADVLAGRKVEDLTEKELLKAYERTRDLFWDNVRGDPPARDFLEKELGFEFTEGRAPKLRVTAALPPEQVRVSLDHIKEKADNPRLALDADNLRFEFHDPNSFREIVQKRHRMRQTTGTTPSPAVAPPK